MGVRVMTVCNMRVVGGFFMMSSFMMLCRLKMVLCGMFVVFGRLAMMFCCLF